MIERAAMLRFLAVMTGLSLMACGSAPGPTPAPAPEPAAASAPLEAVQADLTGVAPPEPVLPPQLALLAGLMPLRSIGADTFRVAHPTYDGRGVVIAILDSGIDVGVPGLRRTSTGERKVLDLRDFSGEGRVHLAAMRPESESVVTVEGHRLEGFGRVARVAAPPYYAGVFQEIRLGTAPEGDVNGNGSITDEFPMVVAKASSGWVLFADTNGDRSLDDESPVHDFAVAGETLAFGSAPGATDPGPMTIAVNFEEHDGRPFLDLFMDNSSHGTHVAGISAGHGLFGVEGFDGVAPGAWLLGIKISNNARGGVSVTGSMLRGLNYAADFAEQRGRPLVVNLSFGVGNEVEGAAAIDSLINEFALKHPDVLVVISAGNDGPGLSTVGFPGSAELGLSVCALFPGVFARPPEPGVPPSADVLGWWSGRGGEVAKPDVCAPGLAFSSVPRWRTGEEVSGGTSMAAPHVSGAVALLLSAMQQQGRRVRAVDLKRALMAGASQIPGATVLDAGAGVADVTGAYRWLLAAHQTGVYEVRALDEDGVSSAAFRRAGLRTAGDTLQRFVIRSVGGQPAARLLLESDAAWLRAPPMVELQGRPETVTVRYDAFGLRRPGAYVGTVWARPATDTIAGPSLGLVNTVVVPHALDRPFATTGELGPGAIARYFLDVSEGRGGLQVRLEVAESEEAILYLFEPSGQPFRGGSSLTAGQESGRVATVHVRSDDLVSGVYEAVVVAPPTAGVRFSLDAALPTVVLTAIEPGPRAVVHNPGTESLPVRVRGELVGAVRTEHVTGRHAAPVTLQLEPPHWATRLVVDVSVPRELWQLLTDFGVTVFEKSGKKVSDAPLNYAFGRLEIDLDSSTVAGGLDLELFPGFAHFEPPETWSADVRIVFELPDPIPLGPDSMAAEQLDLASHDTRAVPLPPVPADIAIPDGLQALLSVRVDTPGTVPSVGRGGTPVPVRAVDETP